MTAGIGRPVVGTTAVAAPGRARATASVETGARWVGPTFVGVVALAAIVFVWNLTISGYANTYYSAAAVAASKSWSAFFFGSFDAANFITIDKPPVALWLMGLSVRLFGLSSWSILLPQALAGVATVAVLFIAVRRSFGPAAATIAGVVMALTPVAALIFRFDNPDALLTLLLVAAAAAVLAAVESGRIRWLVLAGTLVGFAFLTKYLQAYLVLPAFAVTYLVAAPVGLRRRIGGLLVAATTVLVASGWWVAIVQAIPASSRAWIGGSTSNSVLDLIFGYDGLGRIFGSGAGGGGAGAGGAGGAGGGPGGGGGFSGSPGLLRLVNSVFVGQIGWLIPTALIGLASGLVLRGRAPRTDGRRAGFILWGLWFLVHAAVFSYMSGIIHSYYAVAMAPAIAALIGGGVAEMWAFRARVRSGGILLGAMLFVSAFWAWYILAGAGGPLPLVGLAALVVATVAAAAVVIPGDQLGRLATAGATIGLASILVGPAIYTAATMTTAYGGGDPRAGIASADSSGGIGGGFGAGGRGSGPPTAFGPGFGGALTSSGGGAGDGSTADKALTDYLVSHAGSATWIVATASTQGGADIEIATGDPVLAMGGFTGSDPAMTVERLQALVGEGRLRYVLVG
ncbi:MAG: glycosyltransferase family 39 protein, partial [Candidatus Limnocylindrales bacterium]